MSLMLMFTSSVARLACLALLLGVLTPPVRGNIHSVFNIKSGTTDGGCDGTNIDAWFSDAQTLAASAAAGAAATDPDSRKYIETFFSIGPNDDPKQAGDPIRLVQQVLGGTTPPGGKPWLFCSSDWLKQKKWTDVAINARTGNPYANRRTIQQVLVKPKGEVPFWSEDLVEYVTGQPGDWCSKPGNSAATQDQTLPSTITLCVNNLPGHEGATLATIPLDPGDGVSISTLQVQSLNLFHEMFHLALGTQATNPETYDLLDITSHPTPVAVKNPESFTIYALAYHLGQITQYTFANTDSVRKPPPAVPKRAESVLDKDFLARFQADKERLPSNVWLA
ncbi:Uu.00g074880.m01.CDS01 [Anthostomella pinea]|uniref:Uu.00g074880.m01.CDS01 n=1 Tax=Anthostomella pinea TaxID=933095 RepID=A0AAI8VWS1_9PEZI|nr:Uu.00g074880.m01.CDS01 [Anthostomella pinea]